MLITQISENQSKPAREHIFQVWRLREEKPLRFLELAVLRPDSKRKLLSNKRVNHEWVVKALARNPGLVEVLADEDMAKLRKVVKAAKSSRSLTSEVIERAKPLVGVG